MSLYFAQESSRNFSIVARLDTLLIFLRFFYKIYCTVVNLCFIHSLGLYGVSMFLSFSVRHFLHMI